MDLIPILPPLVALLLILITRKAALSLFCATLTGTFLLTGPSPILAIRCLFEDHLFPKISGSPWNISAIIFTLTLGAFATLLEKSGGFTSLLNRLLSKKGNTPQRKLLLGIYGLGFLCFFDGLANALLLGRIARPFTDSLRVSRQFLAYLIDTTSANVACLAFVSTWIAAQLSIISESLKLTPFEINPIELFLSSIPANSYCLLSLLLIPLIIIKAWHIGPMKKAQPMASPPSHHHPPISSPLTIIIPLLTLITTLPASIYLWQDGAQWSWQNAFTSPGVPYAMVASGFAALLSAYLCFPRAQREKAPQYMLDGAASLLPALLILICAWTLSSIFTSLGTAELITQLLGSNISTMSVPFFIFLLGALMSFLTGSSWGTFGLLMPVALPLTLHLGVDLPEPQLTELLSMTVGAVFGGAVFGDHCSPFSDTTIVSALAAGCTPTSHVSTQLPYALIAATGAALSYTLMWTGLTSWLATLLIAVLLTTFLLSRSQPSVP